MTAYAPVVLLILDGWGIAPQGPGNAISLSRLATIPRLSNMYPFTELTASGESVGLPPGEDGNTETGHINIGAGRVVYQDLPRINQSIQNASFYQNPTFLNAFTYAKKHGTNVHLMGLISDSGVHAQLSHLYALLEMAKLENVTNVYLHLFTDGRDSPPHAGVRFLTEVIQKTESIGVGKIATVIGRYYAMDRDHHWERTKIAYEALTQETGTVTNDILGAVRDSYSKGVTDEFVAPILAKDSGGLLFPRISNADAVIFFNYRVDRPRQLTESFVCADFESRKNSVQSFDPFTVKYFHKHVVDDVLSDSRFKRNIILQDIFFVTMTEYERGLSVSVAYPPETVIHPFGEVISDAGLRQLRLAESEKERFVTYYFNGMREHAYQGEDRIIIPSPRVATYDLAPGMSLHTLTHTLLDRIENTLYQSIIVNVANADMVAHTGNIKQAIRACEMIDRAVDRIVECTLSVGGTCIITGDHGNVEEMLSPNGGIDTEHSTYPVPFIAVHNTFEGRTGRMTKGVLGDIAPTMLFLLGLEAPKEMTGKNLLIDLLE